MKDICKLNRLLTIAFLSVVMSCAKHAIAQQNAQFSQYIFNGIYINPAYAGYREQWNAHLFYRKQWVDFPGSPRTTALAIDGIANGGKVGLALQVANDQIGATNSSSMYISYAYRIKLNEEHNRVLAFGLAGGAVNSNVDVTKLEPVVAADPSIGSMIKSKMLPDARFGVFYSSDRFFIGGSADRLISNFWLKTAADKKYLNFNLHLYLTSGYYVEMSDKLGARLSFLLKDDIYGPTSIDFNGFLAIAKTVWIGASYRTSLRLYNKPELANNLTKTADAIGLLEIFLADQFRVGYSYDYSLNDGVLKSNPTHEFSLGYYFTKRSTRIISPRYF